MRLSTSSESDGLNYANFSLVTIITITIVTLDLRPFQEARRVWLRTK